ncbi:hypothetical protein [Sphingomonas bacterium]|uniref:hypothetical protein n=1 Tax=Sphingomonas bacterium TaxID=1895847 RepID=UPI0015769035|nr:hypothetical protein [Sphingomonas bacterium]
MRVFRLSAAVVALALPLFAATAASLQIAKSSSVVADQVSTLNPRALPGSDIDFALVVTNPTQNALATVGKVVIVDTIPIQARLRVTDYGAAGSGPVGFTDGSLLGLGLAGSGLTYGFAGLASATDGLEFSTDGSNWTYTPVPDAGGFDGRVRAIRVTLSGTQAPASAFRLQYRTRLN